ncbi:unnamed protein product [Pylaiella littoralis]
MQAVPLPSPPLPPPSVPLHSRPMHSYHMDGVCIRFSIPSHNWCPSCLPSWTSNQYTEAYPTTAPARLTLVTPPPNVSLRTDDYYYQLPHRRALDTLPNAQD